MMQNWPLPVPDSNTRPFWDGCRQHRLLIQVCKTCGARRFPPTPLCMACHSPETEWIEASGRGVVFSWIVVELPVPKTVFAGDVPYVVALVDLEEGVRSPTNIVGCDPFRIEAGMAVTVRFDRVNDEITLPRFQPAGSL
jgi:uncharacterized OB-fold protein